MKIESILLCLGVVFGLLLSCVCDTLTGTGTTNVRTVSASTYSYDKATELLPEVLVLKTTWTEPEIPRSYKLVVESTAYWVMDPVDASGTGIAADGNPAIPYKTVAVDPQVIPMGSKVFVPGIGLCTAHDTGSAIKGNIVDIAMESRESCYKWGRRTIEVVVYPPMKN